MATRRTIQAASLTLFVGFLLLVFDGVKLGTLRSQDTENEPKVKCEESKSIVKQIEVEQDPDAIYRNDILRRVQGFKDEHTRNGRPEVFGMRGISWLYENFNGMLLAAPELEKIFEERRVVGGKLKIEIRDVSGNPCDAERANLISIYTRLAGPEVMSSLAEPVMGECRWIAQYEVTIPGSYTLLARLLHYNGMQDLGDECEEIKKQQELEQTYVELLHEIPRFPYYNTPNDCCTMCSRFKNCSFSLHADKIRDVKTWGEGTQCLLFKSSTKENKDAIRADKVHDKFNNDKQYFLRRTGSRLGEYPLGTIWQLACGRDEMLLRWAPCGSSGAPPGSSMRGTEDIILFEHEHRDLLIDPRIDTPEWTTIEAAQAEFDAPIDAKKFKPVCDWSKLRIVDFERGRWTRSPLSRYEKCGPLKPFFAENWATAPAYPQVDDPICTLRYDLQNLNDKTLRYSPTAGAEYKSIWRTELSDNYFRLDGTLSNTPFVPGPWVGYFRLHPSSPCRMPPLRNTKQIRQCFIDRNHTSFTTKGDSITEFLEHHLNVLFPAVFPNPGEFEHIREPGKLPVMLFKWPKSKGKQHEMMTSFMSNSAAAHILTLHDMESNIRKVEEDAKGLGKGHNLKIWNTPPFMLWERRQYLTAERTLHLRRIMRMNYEKYGWYEVDYTTLSAAWTIDSTVERDSLHVIGHAMVTLAQLLIDVMCRAPLSDAKP